MSEASDYNPVTMPQDLARVLDQAHDHALETSGADTPLTCDLRYHAGLHRLRTEKTRTLTHKEARS